MRYSYDTQSAARWGTQFSPLDWVYAVTADPGDGSNGHLVAVCTSDTVAKTLVATLNGDLGIADAIRELVWEFAQKAKTGDIDQVLLDRISTLEEAQAILSNIDP